MLLLEYFSDFNITNQGAHHTLNTRQKEHIWAERTRANYLDHRLCIFLPSAINSFSKNLLERKAYKGDSHRASKLFWISMNCSVVNCYVCNYTANKAAMYRKVMFTCLKDNIVVFCFYYVYNNPQEVLNCVQPLRAHSGGICDSSINATRWVDG